MVIDLTDGVITVTHGTDFTVLGQKTDTKEGDWSAIVAALVAIGIEWNYK